MNKDNKWTMITALFITVISVLLAFHLKQHYDQITNENHANKDKINIKNKICAFIKTLHTIEFSLTVN